MNTDSCSRKDARTVQIDTVENSEVYRFYGQHVEDEGDVDFQLSSSVPSEGEELLFQCWKDATSLDETPFSLAKQDIIETAELRYSTGTRDSVLLHILLAAPYQNIPYATWSSLETTVKVFVSKMELQDAAFTRNEVCSMYQNSVEILTSTSSTVREVSVQLPLPPLCEKAEERVSSVFKVYMDIDFKEEVRESILEVDCVCFIQLASTGQVLRPIQQRFKKSEKENGYFLGSFTWYGSHLFHHTPSDLTLRNKEFREQGPKLMHDPLEKEEVILVTGGETVAEPNGARGGRPAHKASGQLLMTKEQVEKIIEIRSRWEGLSSRQRRDNVITADFYPFLTLNRDETAECLGVCATWLKDAIRSQGMFTWPGRPLRRSGAFLQAQKELLESAEARLEFVSLCHPDRSHCEYEIQRLRQSIVESVHKRMQIVKENVSPQYFIDFLSGNGESHLNPIWNALPPHRPPLSPS